MTSRASVEIRFVDLEGSVRRIWFHILDQSSFGLGGSIQHVRVVDEQLRHRNSPR